MVSAVRQGVWAVLAAVLALGTAGCSAADSSSGDDWETAQEVQSSDYAGANWVAANSGNYAAGRSGADVQYIVIHDTEGTYNSAVSWFRNASANVSAHYVIRSTDGKVTQMVRDSDTAWHAGSSFMNHHSIGIEHEGFESAPARWYTDAMYRASAQLVAHLVRKYGIPVDREHIIGHYQVVRGSSSVCDGATHTYSQCVAANNNNHDDPGAGWDWDLYLGYVRTYAAGGDPGSTTTTTTTTTGTDCGAYANYANWNCIPNSRDRVRCVNGSLQRETCATECLVQPVGQDDVCAAVTNEGACGQYANYNYWNCQTDGHTMIKCDGGSLLQTTCSNGCTIRPRGTDDTCN